MPLKQKSLPKHPATIDTNTSAPQWDTATTVKSYAIPVAITLLSFLSYSLGFIVGIVGLIMIFRAKTSGQTKTVCALLCLILPFLGNAMFFPRFLALQNTPRVMQHLEDKYHQKFVVSNVRIETKSTEETKIWQQLYADAHPVDHPELKFQVDGCVARCDEYQKFTDTYLRSLWTHQEASRVEAELKKIFGTVPHYDLTVKLLPRTEEPSDETPPTFESVRTDTRYKTYYSLSTLVDTPLTKATVADHEAKARQLAAFVKEMNTASFDYAYNIKNPTLPTTLRGVSTSDIKECREGFLIDTTTYATAISAANLKSTYHKWCSYHTSTGREGSIAVQSTYPE